MELQMKFVSRKRVKRSRQANKLSDKAEGLLRHVELDFKTLEQLQRESGFHRMSVLSLIQVLRKKGMIIKKKYYSWYRLSFKGRVYCYKLISNDDI